MQPCGTLLVKVYTSNSFIPVPGATVLITKPAAQRPELVAIQFTDESGLIQPLTIPTPPAANSQQPDSGIGWTAIDLLVDHPDYEQALIEGIQIFPEEQTVQNVQLVPLSRFPAVWDRTEDVEITPQDL